MTRRYTKRPPKEDIEILIANGYSNVAIARALNASLPSVIRWRRDYAIPAGRGIHCKYDEADYLLWNKMKWEEGFTVTTIADKWEANPEYVARRVRKNPYNLRRKENEVRPRSSKEP